VLNLGSPNVFILVKMKLLISKFLYTKYRPNVTSTARKYLLFHLGKIGLSMDKS